MINRINGLLDDVWNDVPPPPRPEPPEEAILRTPKKRRRATGRETDYRRQAFGLLMTLGLERAAAEKVLLHALKINRE